MENVDEIPLVKEQPHAQEEDGASESLPDATRSKTRNAASGRW